MYAFRLASSPVAADSTTARFAAQDNHLNIEIEQMAFKILLYVSRPFRRLELLQ